MMSGGPGREIAYEGGRSPTIISPSSMINGRQSQKRGGRYRAQRTAIVVSRPFRAAIILQLQLR